MNYNESWNFIVKAFNEKFNSNESIVQKDWEIYFSEIFGYKRLNNEIDSQRNIAIGSSQRVIPDIIIRQGNNDIFDVELKQYNLDFTDKFEEQLISYLNLLHISIGVLICNKIYVYVYDYIRNDLKKAEIAFIENNPDGSKFIEIFSRDGFDKERIIEFIDNKNKFTSNISKIKKNLNSEYVLDLIKKDMENKGYSKQEIEKALEGTAISILNENIPMTNKQKNSPKEPTISYVSNVSGMDYSKYIFEGNVYGKSRLVLAVVKAYVRDNPTIVYSNLKTIFFDQLQGSTGVIATPVEAKNRRKDPEKRFFSRETIYLKDGTKVWVCTQWGIANIYKFIDRVKKLGYAIEEIKNS